MSEKYSLKKKSIFLPSSQNEIFPYPLNISFSLFPLLKARPVPARPPSGRKARYKRGSKKRINFIFPYRFFFQTRKKKWNNFRTFWTMNFYCNFVQFMLRKKNLKSKKRIKKKYEPCNFFEPPGWLAGWDHD